MKFRSALLALLAFVAVPSATFAQKTAAKMPPLLDSLPADTALVIQIPNVSSMLAHLKATPLGDVQNVPEVAKQLDNLKKAFADVREKAKKEAGVDPWDFVSSAQGEVILSLGSLAPLKKALTEQLSGIEPELTSEAFSVLLSVDTGSSKSTFKDALSKLLEMGKKEGGIRVKSDAFHGAQLTSVLPPDGVDTDGFDGFHFAEQGSRFVFGLSKKYVEEVVASAAAGKSGGLTRDEKFAQAVSQTGNDNDVFMFLNIKNISDSLGGALNATFYSFFWQRFEQLVLGKSLNSITIGAKYRADGGSSRMFVHNDGAKDGMLGWLRADPIAPAPSSFVPESALTYSAMTIDFNKVFGFIHDIAQTAMSFQGGGDVKGLFEQQTGVKFDDLQKSFASRLDVFASEMGNEDNPLGDATFALGLKDAGPLRSLIQRAVAMSGGGLESSKYQGQEILALPNPEMPVGMSVTDKVFLVSVQQDNVKKSIRGLKATASPLASKASFQAAASRAPGKVNLFAFQSREYMTKAVAIYEELISSAVGEMRRSGADVPEGVEQAVFAALKSLTEATGDGAGWGFWKDKGFYVESMTPFVKQKK